MGFADVEPALIASPPLTTVRQPWREMGRVGAALLCRLLDGQLLDAPRVELSTRLVMRASTTPLPSP